MKYLERPSKRIAKGYPEPPKPPKENFWIRLLLAFGTLLVLHIISQYVK